MDGIVIIAIIIGLIVLAVVALGIFFWSVYNKMIRNRNSVEEGYAQIEVQEQQRFDNLNNLVETVKGYASHEEGIFSKFAEARGAFSDAMQSRDVKGMEKAHNLSNDAMLDISAVSEAYPDLKADQNFAQLQESINSLENKLSSARRYYNGAVRDYNQSRQVFPTNIVASLMNFTDSEYFSIQSEEAKAAPKLQF